MAKKGKSLPSDYDGGFYVEASSGYILGGVLIIAAVFYIAFRIGHGG